MNTKDQDTAEQSLYQSYTSTWGISAARISCILTGTLILMGWVLEWSAHPDKIWDFLVVRIAAASTDFALLGLTFLPGAKRYSKALFLAPIFVVVIAVQVMIHRLGGYVSPYYAGLNLCILGFAITVTLPLKETIIVCCSVVLCWLLGGLFNLDEFSFGAFFNNVFFLSGTAAIAIGSTLIRNRVAEKEFQSYYENRKLTELDKHKDHFFANASHELRTPLVSLSSTVQMMLEGGVADPTQHKLLVSSQEALEDMLENVNDILLKTRARKGTLDARWAQIQVASFIDRSLSVFRPLVKKRNIELVFHSGVEDELSAYVDRRHLKKIVNNLLGNAIKFTERGKIEVTLSADAKVWRLSVKDTGKGIPERDLPMIFDPFVQASNNEQREVQGTGLGLSLVKDLVELHQGRIDVSSVLGEGSCFTVTLPLGDAHVDFAKLDASDVADEQDERVNLKLRAKEDVDLSPFAKHELGLPNLLIVEDNPQVLQVLAYALLGKYNLNFAWDGQEGLERMRELNPDLVISDIMMPRKNGYQLAEEMKQDPQLRKIPLILLTSKVEKDARILGFKKGADEYLSKPFNHQEVHTRIEGLLARKKIEAEAIHAEKLVSIGQMAAGIAHEINNPISCINSAAPMMTKIIDKMVAKGLESNKEVDLMRECLEDISESGRRVYELTSALKGHIHPGSDRFETQDIHPDLDRTLRILKSANNVPNIEFQTDYQLSSHVSCQVGHLNQVWMNLMQNAVDAMENARAKRDQESHEERNSRIVVRTYEDANFAFVCIEDNGPGIPLHLQERIFDLFFTTKRLGKGTGMGLYMCKRIIEEHGGSLSLESDASTGTRFIAQLPLNVADDRYQRSDVVLNQTTVDNLKSVQYPHVVSSYD